MSERTERRMPPAEVVEYYATFAGESRLEAGTSRLEFERTKEILQQVLPKSPVRVIDVGGAGGNYSLWLAQQGYEVHLVDTSARLVDVARTRNSRSATPIASLAVADARSLPQPDSFAAAVLVMGRSITSR
jgi:2-polyprenyl-3-methyl-5-hydroxy-6-metoxy-1,4-benzoquinol methylase